LEAAKVGGKKTLLICLGAGYDLRSVKYLECGMVDKVVELDLPEVIDAKRNLLGPKRLLRRRPSLRDVIPNQLSLISVDLNDHESVKKVIIDQVLTSNGIDNSWYTIYIIEGVMIYLDKGAPGRLLDTASKVLRERGLTGSLCFADRLEQVPGGDEILGKEQLELNGWALKEWYPKPGLARHMGKADIIEK